jgi:hypothetical protein
MGSEVTRRVLVGTVHGVLEGSLRSGALRTLDFLNRGSGRLLTLLDPKATNARWQPEGASVGLSAAGILWVVEIDAMRQGANRRWFPPRNRCGIRICLPSYELRGFLHTPIQGDPVNRLNQDQAEFFALTSASVVGDDTEFAAAFVAVNRSQIFSVETLADPLDDAVSEDALAAAEDEAALATS